MRKTMHRWQFAWMVLALAVVMLSVGCGRAGSRATRKVAASTGARLGRIFARDAARDRATPSILLKKGRNVFRYTTPTVAAREARAGFRAGSHFTSRATSGRPMSAASAGQRFGIGPDRTRRIKVTLPPGTPVRFNKLFGGKRGVGEISIGKKVRPNAIDGTVTLRRGYPQ